jgi:hypothetical protein
LVDFRFGVAGFLFGPLMSICPRGYVDVAEAKVRKKQLNGTATAKACLFIVSPKWGYVNQFFTHSYDAMTHVAWFPAKEPH